MMNPLQPPSEPTLPRRAWLRQFGAGFGAIGLANAMATERAFAAPSPFGGGLAGLPHFLPRAKRVIFLLMNGAPSHVDTFDPKPMLAKFEGEQPSGKLYNASKGSGFMPSPFKFAAHGNSGVVMSELFPNLAKHADDLCVIRSMHTTVPNHEPGLLMMNCGHLQPVRPSLGSWAVYGLGSENENLPSFVVLCPGKPVVGPQLWSNSFLPGQFQGTSVDTNDLDVDKMLAHIRHPTLGRIEQREQLDLMLAINRRHMEQRQNDAVLDEQIRAMELAFQMQSEANEAFDVSREPTQTREMYGATPYGQSCLLARRLIERGVRLVQVQYVTKQNKQPWDTHSNNNSQHEKLCADSDRGTAALLTDLKSRGLLDDTLVIWGGEFGRAPYSQLNQSKGTSTPGRDHHHTGFSMFLAGGGIKGGLTYGQTDELGMNAIEGRVHVHDLHATILHLMGVDHTRLTYRYSGRDFRLTDVHGRVVTDLFA
jgi:hypothetical protein